MGLLSSLFGGHPKTTKMKVAGLAASTLDHVVKVDGIGVLVAGSLVLKKQLRPAFIMGKPKIGGDILAVVSIGELEEAELFKMFAKINMDKLPSDVPMFAAEAIDKIVYAALSKFAAQCPAFAALPNVDN